MKFNLEAYLYDQKVMIENKLESTIEELNIPKNLKDSMMYSLMAGGKRLRPILLIATYEMYHAKNNKLLNVAASLEMIHTYSLIHDDLPAMDDDDYRRGSLTNHKKFDEATAILAGDALLTYSFELITQDPLLSDSEKVALTHQLAQASGAEGMIAGQILDMEAERSLVSIEKLEQVHIHKTGKLIEFAISAAGILANVSKEDFINLEIFSKYLGLVFQIQDDILDVIGDEEKLGKPTGSDQENQKSTYPNILGLEGAITKRNEYIALAESSLEKLSVDASLLLNLLHHFGNRDH